MAKRGPGPKWRAGSFFDNFNAAADAVGFDNVDVAWGLARVNWPSPEARDEFLAALTAKPTRDLMNEQPNG